MDKYIKAVLAADNRVIIPRFGCVEESKEEPGKLAFNAYLNYEDGKLAAAVSAGENINTQQAIEKIAEIVDKYNNRLSDGETVSIAGIGSFKSDDGVVSFNQAEDYKSGDGDISLGMGLGLASDAATTVEEQKQAEEQNQAEEQSSEANDDKAPEDEGSHEYEGAAEKKRWPLAVLVIVLLLIIMWLLLFVFFKDNAVYRFFHGTPKPATEQVAAPAPADTTAAKKDTVVMEETKPAKKVKEKEKPAPTVARALESRYNVIVGSYKEEATAIKRVENLHAKGYTDAFVGIRKDYFVAVIKDFTDITQAEAYQEKIVDGPDHIESWITNSGENGR